MSKALRILEVGCGNYPWVCYASVLVTRNAGFKFHQDVLMSTEHCLAIDRFDEGSLEVALRDIEAVKAGFRGAQYLYTGALVLEEMDLQGMSDEQKFDVVILRNVLSSPEAPDVEDAEVYSEDLVLSLEEKLEVVLKAASLVREEGRLLAENSMTSDYAKAAMQALREPCRVPGFCLEEEFGSETEYYHFSEYCIHGLVLRRTSRCVAMQRSPLTDAQRLFLKTWYR
ncbi:hypothetical protein COX00_03495 [Candidatus Uhrbacteria bacterium CG22_combo_CG10-13_8_21_14_all_47_17]|uniref:Methyltransferase type 11 domain-containing protein n=1 Tax=Candidatus Uhrbacteria bacterium CG22_combo_CG10-13_8_21_14_all_47_17 TaxID=1975041 RepID=A0A2H0BRR6_9BACT|nr:MAG: hypothetical protein COX00_03495 [Candidatus Uhrbacteria bacterium CG22_combo_CG10-13_8_21_14_all_47_17]